MSYSWVGAPTEFNGTNEETGGDSGMYSRSPLQMLTLELRGRG